MLPVDLFRRCGHARLAGPALLALGQRAQEPPIRSPLEPRTDIRTREIPDRPVPPPARHAAAARLSPALPVAPALDELTAEERINVAVYQNVNRSVVNINTTSVQADRAS